MWYISFIFLVYLFALSFLLFSLVNIKSNSISTKKPTKQFSIIVAFRNEERNLPALISSFKQLQYPKDMYEIIFVNDHSSDASVEVVAEFDRLFSNVKQLHLNENQNAKKAALQVAIEQAQFEYIITTDADCYVSEQWLLSYNSHLINANSDAVIGSVAITNSRHFLTRFQYYDLMALQAVGFALANLNKPTLCNGANFCYKKEAFFKVKGFQGNENQPSGDDVLLLQKFVQNKLKIRHILHVDNLVLTQAVQKLTPFIQQRKRWFYKTKDSSSLLEKSFGILLLATNLSILLLFILAFFNTIYVVNFILLLIVKFSIDFFFTFEFAKKLKLPFCFTNFALANLFYPIGITLFLGYLTNSKIKWKQREYQP